MRILIYLLCFDDDSQAFIEKNIPPSFRKIQYKIIRLPEKNLFLEFYMYVHYLPTHREEWQNMDYVGTLSWKAFRKCPINIQMTKIKLAKFSKTDLFSFYNVKLNLFMVSEKSHPRFKETWNVLFQRLGFSEEKDIFPSNCPSFFCNYWLAKPTVMEEFLLLAEQIRKVVENQNDTKLQTLLYLNSGYKGQQTPDKLMENFGKPYYIMLPFVLERVICWFSCRHKLKLMF